MAQSINTLVRSALTTAALFQQRVADVRAALPRTTLADKAALLDALRPGVAAFYGIALEVKSTGRAVFPVEHASTDAAKKALQRLARAVQGEVVHQRVEPKALRFTAQQRDAAASLLSVCGGDMARVRAVLKAVQG